MMRKMFAKLLFFFSSFYCFSAFFFFACCFVFLGFCIAFHTILKVLLDNDVARTSFYLENIGLLNVLQLRCSDRVTSQELKMFFVFFFVYAQFPVIIS